MQPDGWLQQVASTLREHPTFQQEKTTEDTHHTEVRANRGVSRLRASPFRPRTGTAQADSVSSVISVVPSTARATPPQNNRICPSRPTGGRNCDASSPAPPRSN